MSINVSVDEKACVGCTLCVDICPTKVFAFDEVLAIPTVQKPAECFGCLSCSEICPASAIIHEGIAPSKAYYQDPDALSLAHGLASMASFPLSEAGDADSVSFAQGDLERRLVAVAAVLKQTLGDSLASVGTQAGRSLATQLPRYQQPTSLDEILALMRATFSPAWELSIEHSDLALTVSVNNCLVRDVCAQNKFELGGDLCTLFYGYLAGYLSKLTGMRPRLMNTQRGTPSCRYSIKLYLPSSGA
jgi:ferredoxin